MSNTQTLTVNRLPAITWNRLRMNEARIEKVSTGLRGRIASQVPDGIQEIAKQTTAYANMETGMGPELGRLVSRSGICTLSYTAPENTIISEPVVLDLSYDAGENAVNSIDLTAEDASEMTVIMKFRGGETGANGNGSAVIQTKYHVGKNALLRIIQVQMLGDNFTFLDDIGGDADDSGRIEVIQLVLGGGSSYLGTRANLSGFKSSFKADIGYLVEGSSHLDMNYVSYQTGGKTESEINASGVLRDNAFKLFRGTIDFRRGCAGSIGNEKEDVLLIDDDVVNQTAPLILCDEEDVVGNHGATIGQLDDSLLFYLQSRGLDKEQVYEMMARARIDAVAALIPDESTRQEIREFRDRDSRQGGAL